jgi:hypothetical protein
VFIIPEPRCFADQAQFLPVLRDTTVYYALPTRNNQSPVACGGIVTYVHNRLARNTTNVSNIATTAPTLNNRCIILKIKINTTTTMTIAAIYGPASAPDRKLFATQLAQSLSCSTDSHLIIAGDLNHTEQFLLQDQTLARFKLKDCGPNKDTWFSFATTSSSRIDTILSSITNIETITEDEGLHSSDHKTIVATITVPFELPPRLPPCKMQSYKRYLSFPVDSESWQTFSIQTGQIQQNDLLSNLLQTMETAPQDVCELIDLAAEQWISLVQEHARQTLGEIPAETGHREPPRCDSLPIFRDIRRSLEVINSALMFDFPITDQLQLLQAKKATTISDANPPDYTTTLETEINYWRAKLKITSSKLRHERTNWKLSIAH